MAFPSARARFIGAAAFTSSYALGVILLERRSDRKAAWQHAAALTLAGVSFGVGGGAIGAGLVAGAGLGLVTAPLYHYAFVVQGLPTLSELLPRAAPAAAPSEGAAGAGDSAAPPAVAPPPAAAAGAPAPSAPAAAPQHPPLA